jgi:hypothetical protein
MMYWFAQTLRIYPDIAIFLSLALGYYFGSFTYKGLGLGAVTATLIAAVIIGQLGITVSGPLKPTFFLMFLFAIGYGVGPQFVRGIAQDGLPQALFAGVVRVLSHRPLSLPRSLVTTRLAVEPIRRSQTVRSISCDRRDQSFRSCWLTRPRSS